MELSEQDIKVKNLDHLGIVAGFIDELGLVEAIDELIPSQRKVSNGTMIKALIINSMGFSQHALYITPAFFEQCPVEHLLGAQYVASDFNDDSIGRCLDSLFTYGLNKLFVQIAHKACQKAGLMELFYHVDTTNFSVEGSYADENNAVKLRHGFAKDKRFDLKQVTLGLITSYQTAIPRYMQAFDGNSSDKKTLVSLITNFIKYFKEGESVGIFISDAGIYSADNISEELKQVEWITRVPETIGEAQRLLEETQSIDMQDSTSFSGYRYLGLKSNYGGIAQRWFVISSTPLAKAVTKTYTAKAESQVVNIQQRIEKKKDYLFKEPTELSQWIGELAKKHPLVTLQYSLVETPYYCKAGRPKAENLRMAQKIDHFSCAINEEALERIVERKSRFILTTNVLDAQRLPDEGVLSGYKSQASSIESGFGFLKDPIFFAESFFVKKPSRLEGLLMIMTLSLLVYSLCERKLRSALEECKQMVDNQINKPTAKPTMRMVFNLFRGIHFVVNRQHQQAVGFCTNLKDNHKKIIRLLGPCIAKYYFLRI
jgi:transposase